MTQNERTVDDYLAKVPEEMRNALEELRQIIKAVVPEATEVISYQIPAFKHQGRLLVGFGAAKDHCTFFLMSTAVMAAHKDVLKGYKVGKGSIQFTPGRRITYTIVRMLVEARLKENAMIAGRGRTEIRS